MWYVAREVIKNYHIMAEECLNDIYKYVRVIRKDIKQIRQHLLAEGKPAYSNAEIMEVLDIGTKTLKQWRDTGMLGYSKIGNTYLYSKEDVSNFLKATHYEAFASEKAFRQSLKDLPGR